MQACDTVKRRILFTTVHNDRRSSMQRHTPYIRWASHSDFPYSKSHSSQAQVFSIPKSGEYRHQEGLGHLKDHRDDLSTSAPFSSRRHPIENVQYVAIVQLA